MSKYLSPEWCAERVAALGGVAERPGASATVQHVVTGGPDGEVRYTTVVVDGRLTASDVGTLEDPQVTITTVWADEVALATGELDANAAFMQGRIKVAGDTGPWLAVLALAQDDEHRAAAEALAAGTTF